MRHALTIAGSDCSGGAGVQADLKTFAAHGVYGMSAIVSVVAENTSTVLHVEDVSERCIRAQIDAVFQDIPVHAVKVGMLSCSRTMASVAEALAFYRPSPVVVDPVMLAKNGAPLMQDSAAETLMRLIVPLATLLTPNIPEAERLCGFTVSSLQDMERAGAAIRQAGCPYVLVKGGHLSGEAVDVLVGPEGARRYSAPRIHTKNTHGTGCTYSSAIAACLALEMPMEEAVERAKRYVTGAIQNALPIGQGHGPTHHFFDLYENGLRKGGTPS